MNRLGHILFCILVLISSTSSFATKPPAGVAFDLLQNTIGAQKCVHVESEGGLTVQVQSPCTTEKAQALANVLSEKLVGFIQITVKSPSGEVLNPQPPSTAEQLSADLSTALKGNRYFVSSKQSRNHVTLKLSTDRIIYNCDSFSPQHIGDSNCNSATGDMFAQIFKKEYSTVQLKCIPKDAQPHSNSEMPAIPGPEAFQLHPSVSNRLRKREGGTHVRGHSDMSAPQEGQKKSGSGN